MAIKYEIIKLIYGNRPLARRNSMKLKNILIVVNDLERSKKFYRDLFGLEVISDQEGNVILTEGLVLQDAQIWKEEISGEVIPGHNASELYFEERDMDGLEAMEETMKESGEKIQYLTLLTELPWGQKMLRFYDPDGNLIEVRTPA